jgi:hypothetical protein
MTAIKISDTIKVANQGKIQGYDENDNPINTYLSVDFLKRK